MTGDEDPPRLVFYKEDVERITSVLLTFLKNAKARGVLLVYKDGYLLTREGEFSPGEMDALANLAVGTFASNAFGNPIYSLLSFERDHIQLSPVGRRTILAVVYGDEGSLGMIRLYAAEVSGKLTEAVQRGRTPGTRFRRGLRSPCPCVMFPPGGRGDALVLGSRF